MNDFSEIEDQLRKLRPVQASPDLAARIAQALAEERSTRLRSATARQASSAGVLPRQHRLSINWLSLGLGLASAAALALFVRLNLDRPREKHPTVASSMPQPELSSANAAPQFVPAGLTQVVYRTRDEGLHFPSNSSQPMRRVRSHTRETLQWRNPKTGASLRISYPSEEVSLTPISGQ
jgi:hypothetical protein